MIRPLNHKNALGAPAPIIAAIFFSLSIAGLAQPSTNQAQPSADAAPPLSAASAPKPITGLLQPSLDAVHKTLAAVRIDRWKKGSIRDEASGNINAIQRDLQANLPPLIQDADAASGTVSKLLPVSRHIDALYDVLLRVTEASRVVAPDAQAAQLQQALLGLGNARLALDERLQGSAGAMEKQVVDLRATIETETARRAAEPRPVALPCVPPPPIHKAVRKRASAAKPAPKPSTPSSTTSQKGANGNQPTTSH